MTTTPARTTSPPAPTGAEARIERVGNLLAGSLILYWFSRGATIFSASYRDATREFLERHGASESVAWIVVVVSSVMSFGLAAWLIWRPADRRIQHMQIVVLVASALGPAVVEPELWTALLTPVTRYLPAIGAAATLLALARRDEVVGRTERRLAVVLGVTWIVHGAIGVVAAPQPGPLPSAFGIDFLTVDQSWSGAVRAGGVFALAAGVFVLARGAARSIVPEVLWTMAGVLTVVSIGLSSSEVGLLRDPLGRILLNLPQLGVVAALLVLGREDGAGFFDHAAITRKSRVDERIDVRSAASTRR